MVRIDNLCRLAEKIAPQRATETGLIPHLGHHQLTPQSAKFGSPKLLELGCWRARIRSKPERAMQSVPLGRLPPGKSGTPPCKSGQLEKDLGLEVSSARQACAANTFRVHEVLFVCSSALIDQL